MYDFIDIKSKLVRGNLQYYPAFKIESGIKDLMLKDKDFYALYNDSTGLWVTNEAEAVELIDNAMRVEIEKTYGPQYTANGVRKYEILYLRDSDNGMIDKFHKYVQQQMKSSYKLLDQKIIFSNHKLRRTDYASATLDYPLEEGPHPNYDKLVSVLYSEEERRKFEWAIGSIIAGDNRRIQKFFVFYGSPGTGKSTIIKEVIVRIFGGTSSSDGEYSEGIYCGKFDTKRLASGDTFATDFLARGKIIAFEDDGDLSKVDDNATLNTIVSHEAITVNQKFKQPVVLYPQCVLFSATNEPIQVRTNSGFIRRLVTILPTGDLIDPNEYSELISGLEFEKGAIAYHCLQVYKKYGIHYYRNYKPMLMLEKTNPFYNFIIDNLDQLVKGTTLSEAYALYKEYCVQSNYKTIMVKYKFKDELKEYYKNFDRQKWIDNSSYKNYYSGFKKDKVGLSSPETVKTKTDTSSWLDMTEYFVPTTFDISMADQPAQYATEAGTPGRKWEEVTAKLSGIFTSRLHYVKLPENYIVIDFDIKDENGNKSLEKNIEAAKNFKPTYAEVSKSGQGLHLVYIYDGDVTKLSRLYDEDIEIKIFTGNSSLRRKLTKCNNLEIAHINSGLPLKKGDNRLINREAVKSEKALRSLVTRALNREIDNCEHTKPAIDFINKVLEDSYTSGLQYDISDLRPAVSAMANNSTHNATYCIKLVEKMHFKSDILPSAQEFESDRLVFFDVEVFPNLFLVNWKYQGERAPVIRLINPTPEEIEELTRFKLVGFNCRRYDNHIMYARMLGYSNEQLFNLSQRIIGESKNALFGNAYNMSYSDVYDFCSKKQSLKKWEIELDIHHQELGFKWDEPVPEEKWHEVAEYCDNDVLATEAVFNARQEDFIARQMLVKLANALSGSKCTVNDTTNTLTAKIVFRGEKNPQSEFVYTDLSTLFDGYSFDHGKSTYRGEIVGEGGYVYSEPGMYDDVALLDIASMHPSSIEALNLFGPYTKNFSELKNARIAIKHKDYISAKTMLNGALSAFISDDITDKEAKDLSNALKIAINSVYGLTSAKFSNPFKDPRNIDNIVAKRGALFMIDLKHKVQEKGYTVAHIKTDSIKIPNATKEIIDFVMQYGKEWGYTFEHEATYDRMCLVNDAVYIAKYKNSKEDHTFVLPTGEELHTLWTATGAQFQVPYVFKTLFSKDKLIFKDLCETKTVTTAMYLDMNENLPEGEHDYKFVGKAGQFCPIKKGMGGGLLFREKDEKYYSVTGTKDYRWLESEIVKELHKEDCIDHGYYRKLVDEAVSAISQYGSFDYFTSEEPHLNLYSDELPF